MVTLAWNNLYAFVLREALVQEDLGAAQHVTERDSPPGKELAVRAHEKASANGNPHRLEG